SALPGHGTRCSRHVRGCLQHGFGHLATGEEGVVGVVVFPFAVAAGQVDVLLQQPVAYHGDVAGARVVIDHVGVGHVHFVAGDDGIVLVDHADADAVGDAAVDQCVTFAGQRLVRRV